MKYQIRHTTVYRYVEPLRHSVYELRLTPRSDELRQVGSWQAHTPDNLTRATDGFSNIVHHFALGNHTEDVIIDARGIVEAFPAGSPGSQRFVDTPGQERYCISPPYFLSPAPLTSVPAGMIDFAREYALMHGDAEPAVRLAQVIATCVYHKPDTTHVDAVATETPGLGTGICQGQAQVMVACYRALGVSTRYASGCFQAVDEKDLVSHAWADVYLDTKSHMWRSIDVTRQCFTDACHTRLAVGRGYQSTAPVRDVRQGGGVETLDVNISIESLSAKAAQVN